MQNCIGQKNEVEKDERKRRYVTELHLAWKTRKQAYYCYMYIDKLCKVARRRQQGGNKMTKKAQMKQQVRTFASYGVKRFK